MAGFGAALQRLRVLRGLSLAELARRVHYSKSYLSRIESGQRAPTRRLADLCEQALDGGGELARLVPEPGAGRRSRERRPAQLPAAVPGFVGRTEELAELDPLPDRAERGSGPAVAVVCGQPGVGKTALAVHWAHRIGERFADGVLFADLGGYGPGPPLAAAEVLSGFLGALGIASAEVPATEAGRAAMLRTLLAGRHLLLLLDNAASAGQVRPLLPGTPGCVAVVTSRSRLAGLVVRDGAARIVLNPLPHNDALGLLASIMGRRRVAAEPEQAVAVARWCGHLPLALRIAAERVASRPSASLADLAGELRTEAGRLDTLAVEDDETVAVRAVFSWSYQALPAPAARAFRLVGISGLAEQSLPALAALWALPIATARELAESLRSAHLVERREARYRMHDLLAVYAAERARAQDDPAELAEARLGLWRWYLHTALAAERHLAPQRWRAELGAVPTCCQPLEIGSRAEGIAWFDTEIANLLAVVANAAEHGGDPLAWQLPGAMRGFFLMRHRFDDLLATYRTGLAAARAADDRAGEAAMLNNLGDACRELGRHQEGQEHLEQALELAQRSADRLLVPTVLNNLGGVYLGLSRLDDSIAVSLRAMEGFRELGDRRGEAILHCNLGDVYRQCGQPDRSLAHLRCGLALFVEDANPGGEAIALTNFGLTYRALGEVDLAIGYLRRAVTRRGEIGDRRGEAGALAHLGDTLELSGRPGQAREAWTAAGQIFAGLGDERAGEMQAKSSTG